MSATIPLVLWLSSRLFIWPCACSNASILLPHSIIVAKQYRMLDVSGSHVEECVDDDTQPSETAGQTSVVLYGREVRSSL